MIARSKQGFREIQLSVTSLNFAGFVLVIFIICQAVPRRYLWIPLLLASYCFYLTSDWVGAIFLVAQTLCAYLAGRLIDRQAAPSRRRGALLIGLIPVLGMLVVLKYSGFVAGSVVAIARTVGFDLPQPKIGLFLPLGVSFFTFAHAGYLIDVFKRRIPAEAHLGRFALFGSFFPQIVSGPIPRAGALLPQLREPTAADEDRLQSAGIMILWGLFKKSVIADRVASYVNPVFDNVHAANGATLAFASYLFAFQIYCDFSGYTDIAIGVAKILGIDLGENFRRPYFSKSVGEFWHRWHISLSTWFRDYLYFPLGGSRVTIPRWVFNVMVVFVVSGLWHGASWTFVFWGALHGLYLVFERLTDSARAGAWKITRLQWLRPAVATLVTFHLVLIAWIFFRADSFSDAIFVVRSLPSALAGRPSQGDSQLTTVISILAIGVLVAVEAFRELAEKDLPAIRALWRPTPIRWAAYISLILVILLLSVRSNGFIYGKF